MAYTAVRVAVRVGQGSDGTEQGTGGHSTLSTVQSLNTNGSPAMACWHIPYLYLFFIVLLVGTPKCSEPPPQLLPDGDPFRDGVVPLGPAAPTHQLLPHTVNAASVFYIPDSPETWNPILPPRNPTTITSSYFLLPGRVTGDLHPPVTRGGNSRRTDPRERSLPDQPPPGQPPPPAPPPLASGGPAARSTSPTSPTATRPSTAVRTSVAAPSATPALTCPGCGCSSHW